MMCEFQGNIPNGDVFVVHGAVEWVLRQRDLLDLYS